MIFLNHKPVCLKAKLFKNNDILNPRFIDAAINLDSWDVIEKEDFEVKIQHRQITFKFEDNQEVYGYALFDHEDRMFFIEKFKGAPFIIPETGGIISMTPKLNLPRLPQGLCFQA